MIPGLGGLVTVAYIGATILFILALGGLSHPESARRGNLYGIIGMSIALVAAIVGDVTANYAVLFGALGVVWAIGFFRWFRDKPSEHPGVNAAELALMDGAEVNAPSHASIPWGRLMRRPTMRAASCGSIARAVCASRLRSASRGRPSTNIANSSPASRPTTAPGGAVARRRSEESRL